MVKSSVPRCLQCIGPLCYDFSDIDEYFNRADVRKQLGVPADRGYDHLVPALLSPLGGMPGTGPARHAKGAVPCSPKPCWSFGVPRSLLCRPETPNARHGVVDLAVLARELPTEDPCCTWQPFSDRASPVCNIVARKRMRMTMDVHVIAQRL